jgi:high-affinity nickel-transport protein
MTMMAALTACTLLGLQHGIDWDHVAAISDVTSVQTSRAKATRCGFLYALGHAATVGLLGITVIVLGRSVPESVSGWMQKVVGFTLLLLGAYVFSTLFSPRGPVSRGQAILHLLGRLHRHNAKASEPSDQQRYGSKSALSLGVLHGIGAETPTQLTMLAIAMNMGGLRGGILGLLVFALAMFVSNMALTAAATSVFTFSKLRPALFRWLGALTGGYSLWIGAVLVAS